MTYPDGTPTPAEHAERARMLIKPADYEEDNWRQGDRKIVEALRGLTHAVLALVGEVEAIREARP